MAEGFTPPGPASYPSTFQSVLTPEFLNSLYSQIDQQKEQDIGAAEGSAISRGITGSPYEAAAVGAANQTADTARNSALQGFLYNLAGMKEKENIIGEGQAYGTSERIATEDWQANQNALDRAMQESMLNTQMDEARRRDTYGLYGEGIQAGSSIISKATPQGGGLSSLTSFF